MSLGQAFVSILPDFAGFKEKLKSGVEAPLNDLDETVKDTTDKIGKEFDDAGEKASKAVGGIGDQFKQLGKLIAGAAIGRAVVDFARDSIAAASDLNESINAVQVTFGDLADEIIAFGESSAEAVGLSSSEFNSFAVRFAGFTKVIASDGKNAADVTEELTTRIADFASVMNLDLTEAATVFASTLAGESEAIRRFGIDMSAASVEAFALESGLIANKNEMNASIKVQAIYAKLMADTAQVAGDFANTSDGLANQQRILSAQFKDLQATIGAALVPVLQGLIGVIKPVLDIFAALPSGVQQVIGVVLIAGGAFIGLSSALQGVGMSAAVANKALGAIGLALTIGIALYSAFKSRGEEARKVQEELNDALTNAADPTIVMIENTKKLVAEYQKLHPPAAEATDAIEALSGATDFVRARIASFIPTLSQAGVSLEDLSSIAQTGTDAFQEIERALRGWDAATRDQSTAEYLGLITKEINNATEAGSPLRDTLMDLARSGGMTVQEFIILLDTLDETADAFDDQREANNAAAKALIDSTEGARTFAGVLGDELFGTIVANAEETAKAAGRSDTWTLALENLRAAVEGAGYEIDPTTGKLTDISDALDTASMTADQAERAFADFGGTQRDTAFDVDAANDKIRTQNELLGQLREATMAMFNEEIRFAQAQKDTNDAIAAYNQVANTMAGATNLSEAQIRELSDASDDALLAILAQADGAAELAAKTAAAGGAQMTAAQKTDFMKQELIRVRDTLAPGSPLRAALDAWIQRLNDVPRQVTTRVDTFYTTYERRVQITSSGMGSGRPMANGGIVSSPTRALIGEAGPEVVIPLTRPQRALELMRESGLDSFMRPSQSGKATVNIENAVFQNGTDADVVAQKVNAAERARSFST